MAWLKAGTDRPSWEDVAPLGSCTKAYWPQWSSLQLVDGVLQRLWETPEGDNVVKQLVVPKVLWGNNPPQVTQHHYSRAFWSCYIWSCSRMILLGEVPTERPRLVPQV